MKKTIATFALIGVLGLTAAGCGGDDKKAETAASLTAKATAICNKVSSTQDAAAKAAQWDKIEPAGVQAMKDLRALTPPKDLKETFNAYVDAQQKLVDKTPAIVAALKAGDTAKVTQLQKESAPLNEAANVAAKAAGVPACGSGA